MYAYIHIHIYTYTHIHICIYIYIYVYIYRERERWMTNGLAGGPAQRPRSDAMHTNQEWHRRAAREIYMFFVNANDTCLHVYIANYLQGHIFTDLHTNQEWHRTAASSGSSKR